MMIWIIFYIIISLIIAAIFLVVTFIWPIFQGAPFIATDRKKIADILMMAKAVPGQKIVDLGSGDGRLLVSLGQSGATLHGYEINPFLVWWSRLMIKKRGLSNVMVFKKNFWQKNLSQYDTVIVFGIGTIMNRLDQKFKKELRPGVKIISNGFALPSRQVLKKIGQLYLYIN